MPMSDAVASYVDRPKVGMRLDEYVTLHVRAQHEAEARGQAVALADTLLNMPGKYAVGPATLEERRREPEFSDLYAVNVYPSGQGL